MNALSPSSTSWLARRAVGAVGLPRLVLRVGAGIGVALGLCSPSSPGTAGEPEAASFRVGVSLRSFGAVSQNDARAALKAWAEAVPRERRLKFDVDVEVFESQEALRTAFTRGTVDAGSMTTEEFARSGIQLDFLYVSRKQAGFTENYVLVVRQDSGVEQLGALRGRKLNHHVGPKTGPALPWLDTVLAQQSLGRAEAFFGSLTAIDSPAKAVLKVFFRQADACLVTADAYEIACEMNPQMRRALTVLLTSPPYVSTFFFFRPGYTSPLRAELEAALLDLHSTPAGLQVLTVFQGSRMERQPVSCLESTLQMISVAHRLPPPETNAPASSPRPGTPSNPTP